MRGTCTVSSPEATGLGVRFAHRSERRFARILSFYRLRWEYEPHTFPLTDRESFTPDFWLPDLDTYVELTHVRRANASRKVRKLRRFRELNPDKRIHVLFRRDLEALHTKYS
ncbi:MAG: hypothetical protein FJ028_10680 [Chloroflexi bacterium]|nr:hypothetical protein [Chloroflexota bacterium]